VFYEEAQEGAHVREVHQTSSPDHRGTPPSCSNSLSRQVCHRLESMATGTATCAGSRGSLSGSRRGTGGKGTQR
jgi:hypothetical protein